MYCILPVTIRFERNKQYDRKQLTKIEPVTPSFKWIIIICFMIQIADKSIETLQILPYACYIFLIKLQFEKKDQPVFPKNVCKNLLLFIGKLLIKFQNILKNTTQVIIRHRVKILFSVISSPITLERQKWKSSKK
jgi:hypothetical protein